LTGILPDPHYSSAKLPMDQQSEIVATALGSTVFIVPMLFSLFLHMIENGGAQRRAANVHRAELN
jgi:hypothetical protein